MQAFGQPTSCTYKRRERVREEEEERERDHASVCVRTHVYTHIVPNSKTKGAMP